ncbi:MAG: aldo/keto reductase [Candidatus Limiplasma sp.]|nr:aldo/keto reductase [Candidatus Limiplasma sp.]
MQYRNDRYGNPISALGFGCMRFTRKGGSFDVAKAEKEVLRAVELGVNYFDTAYLYVGNEACLGEILSRNHLREKVHIATKLPQYKIASAEAIEACFQEELRRLQTDYIDYYLMHMLTDIASWERLEKLGIRDWIARKKQEGAIRQIGFSFHGNTEMFLKILNDYDWDFCQIQYNYMDENAQAGRKGLRAAAEKGIPVIIMEPLRGGRLVELLPEKARALMERHTPRRSPAEWALRWLWNQPEVTCVLSGMNSLEMVEENCRVASESRAGEFGPEEETFFEELRRVINEKMKVGCTGCGYCLPCPRGVDIPGIFRCYNELYTESRFAGWKEYVQVIGFRREPGFASQCVGCGKCRQHCPQGIDIPVLLKKAERAAFPPLHRAIVYPVRRLMFRKTKKV